MTDLFELAERVPADIVVEHLGLEITKRNGKAKLTNSLWVR